jgi:methionyl-tRNA formyltransferase
MRAVIVGAVESTRVAIAALSRAAGWDIAGVVTLSPELAARHSDFVDLAPDAASAGAALIRAADSNSPDVLEAVAGLRPDLGFVIGWSQICRPPFVAAAGGRLVGYHPAPLPRLRGRAALPWTILLREPITAASLFWVDEGVDSGPIIAQRFFHVAPDETVTLLYARHMEALAYVLDDALPRLAAGDVPGAPQDDRFATWAARRTARDGAIDWFQPAEAVDRLIRAVTRPYPGAFTDTAAGRLTLWHARPWPESERHAALPGQVLRLPQPGAPGGLVVMCGDGRALDIHDWEGPLPKLHSRLGATSADGR